PRFPKEFLERGDELSVRSRRFRIGIRRGAISAVVQVRAEEAVRGIAPRGGGVPPQPTDLVERLEWRGVLVEQLFGRPEPLERGRSLGEPKALTMPKFPDNTPEYLIDSCIFDH